MRQQLVDVSFDINLHLIYQSFWYYKYAHSGVGQRIYAEIQVKDLENINT